MRNHCFLLLCLCPCFVSFVIIELSSLSNAEHPRVVSVFLNQGRKQHTTHSWSFLGLEKDGIVPSSSIWKKARFGEDAIIGNLDTGNPFFLKLFTRVFYLFIYLSFPRFLEREDRNASSGSLRNLKLYKNNDIFIAMKTK